MEVIDALSVVTRDGKTTTITALPRRDELFNRLIALSSNVSAVGSGRDSFLADTAPRLSQRWDSY
jgi:hypothetical protein